MFDIGWSELAVIGVIALIVIGPKDLPRVLYMAGKMAAKARGMVRELQQGIEELAREAELDDMRKKIGDVQRLDLGREIERAVDPKGELAGGPPAAADRPARRPEAEAEAEDDAAIAAPPRAADPPRLPDPGDTRAERAVPQT